MAHVQHPERQRRLNDDAIAQKDKFDWSVFKLNGYNMRKRRLAAAAVAVILLVLLAVPWFSGGSAAEADGGGFTVTLEVRADNLLHNMHLLDAEKHELVPPDGLIFPAAQVTAFDGESVFDVLQREMRGGGIHMVARFTPLLGSSFVEGINNLHEFDAGALSGWVYVVNGQSPDIGSSQYMLRPGDVIEWVYTLDLGRDVAASVVANGD